MKFLNDLWRGSLTKRIRYSGKRSLRWISRVKPCTTSSQRNVKVSYDHRIYSLTPLVQTREVYSSLLVSIRFLIERSTMRSKIDQKSEVFVLPYWVRWLKQAKFSMTWKRIQKYAVSEQKWRLKETNCIFRVNF